MSLVNDMLRDLDQRRRESDGGGAKVKLTPASEFPKTVPSNKTGYILAGLVLVVLGLGFFWFQLVNDTSSQPVNVRPVDGVSFPVANNEGGETAPTSSASTDSESTQVNSAQGNTIERTPSQSGLAAVRAENPEPTDIISQAVEQNRRDTQPPQSQNQSSSVQADRGQVASESASRLPDDNFDDGGKTVDNVDLTSGIGIDQSVKNAAIVSEDEQDTLAVQESLRLIANNDLNGAYVNLEQHILGNRYAHQSRETYAKLLMSENKLQEAYALLEEGLVLSPNHAGFKKVKARVLIQNGHVLDAVQLLLARAPLVSEDLEYHEILASAQLASRDYSGAVISYSGLVGENQGEGKFWYGYAASQELLGNTDIARQAYSRAVQQSSLSASLRRRSQDRLLALGQ